MAATVYCINTIIKKHLTIYQERATVVSAAQVGDFSYSFIVILVYVTMLDYKPPDISTSSKAHVLFSNSTL